MIKENNSSKLIYTYNLDNEISSYFLNDKPRKIYSQSPRLTELELYFHDVYHLLHKTLLELIYEPEISSTTEYKIEHLVTELIKTKKILSEQTDLTDSPLTSLSLER